jgi:alpha-N-arabinofuranosidase
MKMIDPNIETAVCGSTSFTMPHYPQWDLDVLKQCYESVDYISLHYYHSAPPGDYAALLGGSRYVEDYIDTIAAQCDFVQAQYRSPKKLMLSFDEYGTMPREPQKLNPGRGMHSFLAPHYTPNPESRYIRHDPDNMTARRFPQGGDMLGALTSASTILAFLRRADRVKIGCMTGGLRALAATSRENVWKPAAYYPYTQLIQYGRGVSLQAAVDCDTFDIPGYIMNDTAQFYTQTDVKFIDTAAAHDEENGALNIFIINKNWEDENDIEIDTDAFKDYRFIEHIQLYSDDMDAMNTYESPETVVPSVNTEAKFKDGKIISRLKKLSWNVFRLEK